MDQLEQELLLHKMPSEHAKDIKSIINIGIVITESKEQQQPKNDEGWIEPPTLPDGWFEDTSNIYIWYWYYKLY